MTSNRSWTIGRRSTAAPGICRFSTNCCSAALRGPRNRWVRAGASRMPDRQSQYAGTAGMRPGQEIDTGRLDRWLQSHVEGYAGPLLIEQFKGGQSNPTYKLRTPSMDYVLRRKPPGELLPGAHAVDREFRVISALARAGFPVARAYALCSDTQVIGTAFYVMQMVEGRIFWDTTLPGLDV